MLIRIGEVVISPNAFFFVMAGLFFIVLAARHVSSPARLGVIVLSGAAGAWVYGALVNHEAALQFGSFGGTWGVLLAAAGIARYRNRPVPECLDGFVSAILVAMMVGRLGCLFSGCCRGYVSLWPLWDVGAAAIAWACAHVLGKKAPGVATATFLGLYGVLRFGLEWLRVDTWSAAHAAALVQTAAGLLAWAIVRRGWRGPATNGIIPDYRE